MGERQFGLGKYAYDLAEIDYRKAKALYDPGEIDLLLSETA